MILILGSGRYLAFLGGQVTYVCAVLTQSKFVQMITFFIFATWILYLKLYRRDVDLLNGNYGNPKK